MEPLILTDSSPYFSYHYRHFRNNLS